MKEYKPESWIPFPPYMKMIIQYPIFFLLLIIGEWIKRTELYSLPMELLLALIMLLTYKFLGTFSAVDLIIIDTEHKRISFTYWFLYCVKKKISIDFESLKYKNKHNILIAGGYSIYFYENKNLKIKLNSSNGWKGEQLDEIIEDLLKIKEPLKRLVERTAK
jgi:hypothetical protein